MCIKKTVDRAAERFQNYVNYTLAASCILSISFNFYNVYTEEANFFL